MIRIASALFILLLACSCAMAQGCGQSNPNCIVPDRPAGDSTEAAANTKFVTNAAISPSQLPPGVLTNVSNVQTGTYALQTSDCGKTVPLTGGAFYTLSVGAASGFPATCRVLIVDADTRGKTMSIPGVTVGYDNILRPGQSFWLVNQNGGGWTIANLGVRWPLTTTTNLYVDPVNGSDSNDGLAAGAGNAWQTIGKAVTTICSAIDLRGQSLIVNLANGTYSEHVVLCELTGYLGSSGYGQVTVTATPASVTTPVASPGVVNWTGHGVSNGQTVFFYVTGGSLPTGLTQGVPYFVINAATNTFQVALTQGGSAINFTGSSTGTQTAIAPSKTKLDATGGSGVGIFATGNNPMTFKGVQFVSCAVACIEGDSAGVVALDSVDFGTATGNHVISLLASRIAFINNGYSITGNAGIHLQTDTGGVIFVQPNHTIAVAPVTFSVAYAFAKDNSIQYLGNLTFNGSATCTAERLGASLGGGIDSNGGGATYLPCSAGAAGNNVVNPGWYN